MDILVSIVIPVYNVSNYVGYCLDSVTNQTYANLQIIVIDDGSTDNSYEICKKIAEKDKRITLLTQANGGISAARNNGIDHATGDYIMFVDSDDYIHKHMVETLLNLVKSTDSQIGVCGFKRVDKYEEDSALIVGQPIISDGIDALDKLFNSDKSLEYVVAWNKIYKRELFADIRFPIGRINEDEFVTYKLFKEGVRSAYISTPLYFYVQREGSITHSDFSEKRFDKVVAFIERAEWLENTCYCSDAYKFLFIAYISFLEKAKQSKQSFYRYYRNEYKKLFSENRKKMTYKHRITIFIRQYIPSLYRVLQ